MASDIKCSVECLHKDSIASAKKSALKTGMIFSLADFFRILGDPTRVKIIHALSGRELCVCDLSFFLEMNQSAVSHQLRTLKDSRFVVSRKEGKVVYYSLADEHITQILDLGIVHLSE
jgi:ArsR family transcriptional regulator